MYEGRWIVSGVFMMPFFYLFKDYVGLPLWENILISQLIGGAVFFKIDKFIFKGESAIICS